MYVSPPKHLTGSSINSKEIPIDADKMSVKILCKDISNFSKFQQFTICSVGVFFCYIPYGYFQELIFQLKEFKPHGWFLTFYQFFLYTTFASCESVLAQQERSRTPISSYFLLASLTVATMGLSNTSVGYLNYPTQVIFKCCKLIPVMIGGILIQGKKYGPIDFLSTILMSIGLIFFMLADKKVSPDFNSTGVILISLALIADSVIGNVQEKLLKTYRTSNVEMVFYSYGIGFIYILVGCLFGGHLNQALHFSSKHLLHVYGYGFIFSLCGYIGIQVILAMIYCCGALTTVTMTTFRKALSIALSFLIIAKPFTFQYFWAGAIVLFGIYLSVCNKHKSSLPSLKIILSSLSNYARTKKVPSSEDVV